MRVTIKTSKRETHNVEVENEEVSVDTLKNLISEQLSQPKDKMKLIFSGQLLKDENPLSTYKIQNGSSVHLIISGGEKKASPPPAPEAAPTSTPNSSQPADFNAYFNMMNQGNNQGGITKEQKMWGPDQKAIDEMMKMHGGGNTEEARAAIMRRAMEMMKDPEQMKAILEPSLAMHNIPESSKKALLESANRFAELSKSDPEQFQNIMDYVIKNPDLANMTGNPFAPQGAAQGGAQGGMPGMPGNGGPRSGGARPTPESIMYTMPFDKSEAMQKYAQKLAELESIGYTDSDMNLIALVYSDGDLSKALNLILDWTNEGGH
ncbi:hypothetical protein NEFER03_1047 [Nematocida sp. LUAm3]|nr:hypothetical protein NEFER03_1047 [Nematocida sp. LUAm3]KAI5175348.1 hypothetical protein NEFER02_1277 [Nematocida sp. LUAm2]KAI5177695.1 hypothetical protein NEFER01_0919 [Nematocida sp. LUAm1]